MKKLFEMGSLLSLEEMTSFKILGRYELVKMSRDVVEIRKEGYVIRITASDLQFDMLMKQSALLSFSELHELFIQKEQKEGDVHEA